ncbi:response regulator [Persicobacter psychrovividus]|uniref:Response regulator n=1 Tax=Persicobacter psychrovividus TaxID=387638 RepID=A0ABM7VDX9_9BACT|nr:response regulator [Persicobacter psychrovividus]
MHDLIRSVFLVDDNPADNFYHSIVIKKTGFDGDIVTLLNGEDLINELKDILLTKRELPDLIFMDINMPRMSAWDVLDELRLMQEEYPIDVCIFLLTTSRSYSDVRKSKDYPMVKKLINKPIGEQDFVSAINAKLHL